MNWYKRANTYIAYHGTNQEFDSFMIGQQFQDQKGRTSKDGFWFTDSLEEATEYANYSADRTIPDQINHEKKMQDYLRQIEEAEQKGDWGLQEKLTMEMEAFEFGALHAKPSGQKIIEVVLTLNNPYVVDASPEDFDAEQAIEMAKRGGHDGVIFNNISDSPKTFSNPMRTTQYLIFDTSNIKIRNTMEV